MAKNSKMIENVSGWLLAVGGLVWLGIGVANFNFLEASGLGNTLIRVVYSLVGISAIIWIVNKFN